MKQHILSTNWQLKEREPTRSLSEDFASTESWLPASVPGTVHQDLLAAGRIPDPFIGLNELDVQWVGERNWTYERRFDATPELLAQPEVDTEAAVRPGDQHRGDRYDDGDHRSPGGQAFDVAAAPVGLRGRALPGIVVAISSPVTRCARLPA